MSPATGQSRKMTYFDYALLALLAILVYLGAFGFARSWTQGTLLGSRQAVLPSLEELTPYTTVEGDVQRIYVDTAFGFNPQTIMAEPGIPLDIEFGPAGGDSEGCYSSVKFPEFGIGDLDVTDGAVVSLPALEPGQYQWSCWMDMAFGLVVVE